MSNSAKLGRDVDHRKALYKNLISALVLHGQVKTTLAKAKAVKPRVDRLINKAKDAGKQQREVIAQVLPSDVAEKLYADVLPKLNGRRSGYTRLIRISPRKGDNAKMAIMELIVEEKPEAEEASTS